MKITRKFPAEDNILVLARIREIEIACGISSFHSHQDTNCSVCLSPLSLCMNLPWGKDEGAQTHLTGKPTQGVCCLVLGPFHLGSSTTMLEEVKVIDHDFQQLGQCPKCSSCPSLCSSTPPERQLEHNQVCLSRLFTCFQLMTGT